MMLWEGGMKVGAVWRSWARVKIGREGVEEGGSAMINGRVELEI